MNGNSRPTGPTDPRNEAQREQDRETIRRQIRLIKARRHDRRLRAEASRRLQRQRDQRSDVPSIDILGSGEDATLAVQDEFLLAAADVEAYEQDPLPGYRHTPVLELDRRVYRVFRVPSTGQGRAHDAQVARRGLKRNFVTPMGIVMKALCGPENTAGPGLVRPASQGVVDPKQIAVIDTGISSARRADAWLSGVEDPHNRDPLYAMPNSDVLALGAGHGTFAAGIVEQLAPEATIRAYRALDSDGLGTELDVAIAMVQAAAEGADIMNLSLGFETEGDEEPIALRAAVDIITESHQGVLIVAAAGNTGRDRKCWPGGFDDVVSVAALTQALRPADWSTHGDWVNCSTIGEGVLSTYVVGTEDQLVDPDGPDAFVGPNPWALWTGTSFAAPQVAGRVAAIATQDDISVHDALEQLLTGRETVPGYGKILSILPPS